MPIATARATKQSQDRAHRAVIGAAIGFFAGFVCVWGGCGEFGVGFEARFVALMVMAGIVAAIPGALIGASSGP